MIKDKKNLEIEVKIKINNISDIVEKILKCGFILIQKKYFETNIVFDTVDNALKKKNFLLRLRNQGKISFLTFKKPVAEQLKSSQYKEREEIEVEISDFKNMKEMLLSIGFQIFFIYEKYREVFQKEEVKIMVDQTPIGNFMEIEGEKKKIDNIARQLGYNKKQYIVDSYFSLFKKSKRSGFMEFK